MGRFRDIDNLDETKIELTSSKIDDEASRQLWSKNQLIFNRWKDFWYPLIKRGKTCMDYMHGHIFDDEIRGIYENVQRKICIEPMIFKPRINSICGQILQGRKSGKIITESGQSTDEMYLANAIMKYYDQELDTNYLMDTMLFDGLTTACPQVLWFDGAKTAYGDPLGGLTASIVPWDSLLMMPYFERPDGSDSHGLIRIMRQTEEQLIEENFEREDAIREFYSQYRDGYNADWRTLIGEIPGLNVEDARYLYTDIMTGQSHTRLDGRSLVVERVFQAKTNSQVAVHKVPQGDDTVDYQMIPPEWDRRRVELWKRDNPDYEIVKEDVNTLWISRWTREGLMLKNEMHWFQEHDKRGKSILPMATFVPQIIDKMPTSPGVDIQPLVLMKAIAETEFLHNVRTGSGDLFMYLAGAIKNADDLPTELSIGNGMVAVDPEQVGQGGIDAAAKVLKRTANTTYNEYSQKINDDLDSADLINKGVQGMHVAQQSGKAKQTEIAQAVVGYSIIVNNFNKTYERIRNIQFMTVPYVFTEPDQVIQIYADDEQQGRPPVVVNQVVRDMAGNAIGLINDLSTVNWRFRLSEGDDSPTAREQELNEMLIFWNTTAPTLITADETLSLLSSVLVSMNNKTARDIGKVIAQKANAQAQQMSQSQMMETMAKLEEMKAKAEADRIKAMRSGFSFSVSAEDLAQYPAMYQLLVNAGYINEQKQFRLPPERQTQQQSQQQIPQVPTPGGI